MRLKMRNGPSVDNGGHSRRRIIAEGVHFEVVGSASGFPQPDPTGSNNVVCEALLAGYALGMKQAKP